MWGERNSRWLRSDVLRLEEGRKEYLTNQFQVDKPEKNGEK